MNVVSGLRNVEFGAKSVAFELKSEVYVPGAAHHQTIVALQQKSVVFVLRIEVPDLKSPVLVQSCGGFVLGFEGPANHTGYRRSVTKEPELMSGRSGRRSEDSGLEGR
jgi:hypothetical protein